MVRIAVLLDLAILNNASWCSAVVAAHGIGSAIEEHYWSADGAVPLYYSNLITRTEHGESAQLGRIRALAAAPPKRIWSVKDSFARLDLTPLGLRELFDARWFGLDAGVPVAGLTSCSLTAAESLEQWERSWQLHSPAPGQRIFPDSLLEDPAILFLEANRDGEPVGGAVLNRSPDAVGLSNVFPGGDADLARDCVRCARALYPDRALVGYGREADLAELAPLGIRDLGPLRVWISEEPKVLRASVA